MSAELVGDKAYTRLPDQPDATLKIGALIAGAFFVAFLGWAALTPLDAGSYAHGLIAVAGNRQAVQVRDGGIVTRLAVQEGENVKKGQVLLELSASEVRSVERGLTAEVYALWAQRARLQAERDGAPSLSPPAEFAAIASEDRPLAEEALELQRRHFAARRAALSTQRGVLVQRSRQLAEQTSGAERQLDANRRQQDLVSKELRGVKALADEGYAPQTRVLALERNAASLAGEDGAYRAQIARSREAIGESRLQLLSLERERMEEIADQMREVQVKLDELQPKLSAAREQLSRAIVRAPTSGKVVGLKVFTVGGVAAPNQTLMEIVPQNRRLVIQAKVSPADVDDLSVGQRTQVRFSTIHDKKLPLVDGRLETISADSLTDEKTGAQYFSAEIAVPEAELDKIRAVRGAQTRLQAGMPVEVLVPLRKRSALAYLIDPITQTFWRFGRES
ncbi:HlyD family type I secretion periplasmic adaptor subunit [Caulobacter endophyticus]|uniref:Membrane fusion protein (MFP) family protein n=1 Tax=Caulobacter endophyticus TaxID=2172652 RepID=A0A2T9JU97_9CAUL|nr:HlyD family type I secretion periplasmic adaptor subunit [Caulobacter endophyticus]PVM87121.1 HlyD family type I secretion periplasmic adaptor subunit [Caulobacter endophyticus]